ncbi:hypothetical protein OHT61_32415 (plasmid) [Streptomyces sp. NBC_00178]|uniref:hypothetical protein n=1 Tax=Streptomyces sp. NBC_00178 TaxID=2975672 RepID=UPI002E2B9591|nr:hypothetical protein [Streptomyces sp. NBC_00178]
MAAKMRRGPDDFSDDVLASCPGMSDRDQQLLRAAVREGLEGYPAVEWTVRFADVIIDNRAESFAKPFFDRSVARGVRELLE